MTRFKGKMGSEQEPVVADSYPDAFAAHAACARLEAEGVDAMVVDENVVTVDPLLLYAVGGVKVVVPRREIDAARAILATKVEDASHDFDACPECGSQSLHRERLARRLSFLSIFLFMFPLGRARTRVRCEDCGHRWRE